eukprot:s642_g20.t3
MAPFSASFRFSVGIGPNRAKPGQTGPNRGTMAGAAEMASLSLGVLVPGAEAGRLIGKQGSGLKQIRDMSQCKVQLGQTPDSQGNRRCDISGPTVEHMASAIHAIGTRLFDQAAQQERVQLSVAFPNAYVGRVIGKGGSNLKNIFDQTGVEMKLLKDAVSDQGDRVGHLTGIPNQLGAAIRIALNACRKPLCGAVLASGCNHVFHKPCFVAGLYNLCCEEKSEYVEYAADVMAATAKLRASLEGMENADSTIFDPDFVVQDGMAWPRAVKGAMLCLERQESEARGVEEVALLCLKRERIHSKRFLVKVCAILLVESL